MKISTVFGSVLVVGTFIMVGVLIKLQIKLKLFSVVSDQYHYNMSTLHLYYNSTFIPSNTTLKIFYFGITHHLNREKALACQKTWVRTLPNMHWYSDKPDMDLNATVISYKRGNTYQLIVFRMVMILEHVGKNYPDYDWYVRLWDDNYIFKERLERLLIDINTSIPVIIGRLSLHKLHGKDNLFVGGGAGWVFNRGAFGRLLNADNSFACNEDDIQLYLKNKKVPVSQFWSEDVWISQCFIEADIKFVFSFGFLARSLDHPTVRLTAKEVVSGRLPFVERNRSTPFLDSKWWNRASYINVPNKKGVITLHYVKPREMFSVYEQHKNVNTSKSYS